MNDPVAPDETPRTPHFEIRRFASLRPHHLDAGTGTVRDVWADSRPGKSLRWMLSLLELRGPRARQLAPAGTEQLIIGLSGPQVRIGASPGVPLRRDHALRHTEGPVEMQRPLIRVTGASRILSLAFNPRLVSATTAFATLDGEVSVPGTTTAVAVVNGELEYAGERLGPGSALIFRSPPQELAQAKKARVISLEIADVVVPTLHR
jgi:hypothetical protein